MSATLDSGVPEVSRSVCERETMKNGDSVFLLSLVPNVPYNREGAVECLFACHRVLHPSNDSPLGRGW